MLTPPQTEIARALLLLLDEMARYAKDDDLPNFKKAQNAFASLERREGGFLRNEKDVYAQGSLGNILDLARNEYTVSFTIRMSGAAIKDSHAKIQEALRYADQLSAQAKELFEEEKAQSQ